ncbi:MAG: mandelate racemase/muconate lactonizing enzyme family protein [Chthoniobacterales bacterium]
MKLKQINAWVVQVPLLKDWATSEEFGPHMPKKNSRTLLQLIDESGAEGWGESAGNALAQLEGMAERLFSLDLRGTRLSMLDLWEKEELYWSRPAAPSPYAANEANLRHRLRHPLQSLLECALVDLNARRSGLPISDFFGGRWRDAITTDYWAGRVRPDHAAECAKRGKSLGFNGIKFKTTLEDPNVERLEAVKKAVGVDFHVTLDPNGRFYRLGDAWKTIQALDKVGNLGILEDPFPRFYLTEFAELRQRIDARLVLHIDPVESFWSVLEARAAGGLNLDSHTIGPFQWRILAGAAEQANLPIWHGSGLDLGVGTAWQLHLASTAPNCQLPGDQAGPWLREHSLVNEEFVVKNGCISVPTGPGIGVSVDRDALERYTADSKSLNR